MRDDRGFEEGAAGARGVLVSQVLPAARFIGCDDMRVASCTDDVGRCRPGDVFVARLTPSGDGHDLVPLAVERGVAGVIAERIVATAGTPLCLVPNSDRALARLQQALAGAPAAALRVIAITGTSGKTTTAWLTGAVLAEAGLRVGVISDLGCTGPDGTTSPLRGGERPAALAAALARLAAAGCSHAVVEVSSRMLARHALAGVECDSVVVTNLGTAHLDLHGTPRAYRAIKGRIIESLSPRGCLVADGRLGGLLDRAATTHPAARRLTVGFADGHDVSARPVERGLWGQTFLLSALGDTAPVSVDSPVTSFVRDAMSAAAVGLAVGVPLETAVRGLEAAGVAAGRMERIDCGQDAAVFADVPTSLHALGATLRSLRRLTPGRLALVADERVMAELGGERLARRVRRSCDDVVIVPGTVAAEQCGPADLEAYARLDRVLSRLGTGDCALVVGAAGGRRGGPGGPPLAVVVEGWLRLCHPADAEPPCGHRAA